MKKIKRAAFQGDMMIIRRTRADLPEGCKELPVKFGEAVVAHSETGHHHVASGITAHLEASAMQAFIIAKGDVVIDHRRQADQHETLQLLFDDDPGGEVVWEIRRQREHTPEGWRRVED